VDKEAKARLDEEMLQLLHEIAENKMKQLEAIDLLYTIHEIIKIMELQQPG